MHDGLFSNLLGILNMCQPQLGYKTYL